MHPVVAVVIGQKLEGRLLTPDGGCGVECGELFIRLATTTPTSTGLFRVLVSFIRIPASPISGFIGAGLLELSLFRRLGPNKLFKIAGRSFSLSPV